MKNILVIFALVGGFLLFGVGCPNISSEDNQTVKLEMNGLTFDIPSDWSVRSIDGVTAYLSVPDSKYDVVIPFQVSLLEEKVNSSQIDKDYNLEPTTIKTKSGATIYSEFCAPAILCRYVLIDNAFYMLTFEVPQSNEPVPENLDGVWFPKTEVTDEQCLDIIKSVR